MRMVKSALDTDTHIQTLIYKHSQRQTDARTQTHRQTDTHRQRYTYILTNLKYTSLLKRILRYIIMGTKVPANLHPETYNLLVKIQKVLPGKPTLISLLDEAVKLLAEKHLKPEE